MAEIPGYEYVDVVRPDTGATERVPKDWAYYAGEVTGWTIKPGVPWPSDDQPAVCEYPRGIVPESWLDFYGELTWGKELPKVMPDGPADPEPDPEPEPLGPGAAVAAFLGRSADERIVALADVHRPVVAEFVNAYVRGNGTTREADGSLRFPRDLDAVVTSATARLVVNPAQTDRESADGYSVAGSFKGFTLAELAVLGRYRRKAA